MADLLALRARIERSAAEAIARWEQTGRAGSVDLGIAADGHEAQSLGWPCVGAQRASLALLVAAFPLEVEVRIVPRGSTPATAAAADAHQGRQR